MNFPQNLLQRGDAERTPFSSAAVDAADAQVLPVIFDAETVWINGGFSDVFSGKLDVGEIAKVDDVLKVGRIFEVVVDGKNKKFSKVAAKRMRYATEKKSAAGNQLEMPPAEAAMFWKEASILTHVKHDNIMPFLGLCLYMQQPCFVTPWVDFTSLLQYLQVTKDANIYTLLAQITSAMVYLHEGVGGVHIVHGDLHDKNVLVQVDPSRGAKAILCDFGLSKLVPKNHFASNSYDGSSGVRLGYFLAPELQPTDPDNVVLRSKRTDVFAFGVLVYVAYNRERLYPTKTVMYMNTRLLKGERPGRPDAQDLTEPMWQLIQDCWAHAPEKRPADMVEVQTRLLKCE